MRKLKLQMQITIDGFVAGPNGELDWMTWDWDEELKDYADKIHETVDCILLGGGMAEGFVTHWEAKVRDEPESEEGIFGRKMVETRKVVFSKSVENPDWKNCEFEKGELAPALLRLKAETGGDIIVYGGARFVSSLIREGHIDEFYFCVNPVSIGKGMKIFEDRRDFKLAESKAFDCGVVLIRYEPKG